MTEKEKMMAGLLYDGGDPELATMWHKAKELLREFNNTPSTNKARLNQLLEQLLGGKGKNLWITAPFFCDFGENIFIGDNSEINHNCVFLDCNRITIGKNALIGPAVQIYAAFHPLKASDRVPGSPDNEQLFFLKTQSSPVTIGDNVWIGGGSIILPGITIGNNVTIGAGSVVTKDIPDNVLAVGNPCRVIREL